MSVYQRPDSKFYQYEFEIKGQRYRGSTECSGKRDALLFEAAKRKEVLENLMQAGEGIKRRTLGEVAEAWLEMALVQHRDWKNDESRVRKLFGAEKQGDQVVEGVRYGLPRSLWVHEMAASHLTALIDARRREGNSVATINREISLVQGMFSFTKDRQTLLPKKEIDFEALKGREPKGKLRYLTLNQELAFFVELQKKHDWSDGIPRIWAQDQIDLCIFLLDTGARHDEVSTMTRDVIDMDRRVVNLYRWKTGSASDLKMTERLYRMLERRMVMLGSRRYLFPAGDRKLGWSREDKPRGWATTGIQRSLDKAGINPPEVVEKFGRATAHTFRDTFASRLVQAGRTLYEVSVLLGHANERQTQKYAKLLHVEVSAQAADTLDRIHREAAARLLIEG